MKKVMLLCGALISGAASLHAVRVQTGSTISSKGPTASYGYYDTLTPAQLQEAVLSSARSFIEQWYGDHGVSNIVLQHAFEYADMRNITSAQIDLVQKSLCKQISEAACNQVLSYFSDAVACWGAQKGRQWKLFFVQALQKMAALEDACNMGNITVITFLHDKLGIAFTQLALDGLRLMLSSRFSSDFSPSEFKELKQIYENAKAEVAYQ